jgi:hypothetical protein
VLVDGAHRVAVEQLAAAIGTPIWMIWIVVLTASAMLVKLHTAADTDSGCGTGAR